MVPAHPILLLHAQEISPTSPKLAYQALRVCAMVRFNLGFCHLVPALWVLARRETWTEKLIGLAPAVAPSYEAAGVQTLLTVPARRDVCASETGQTLCDERTIVCVSRTQETGLRSTRWCMDRTLGKSKQRANKSHSRRDARSLDFCMCGN